MLRVVHLLYEIFESKKKKEGEESCLKWDLRVVEKWNRIEIELLRDDGKGGLRKLEVTWRVVKREKRLREVEKKTEREGLRLEVE